MDNTFNAKAMTFVGTILQLVSTQPQLVATLNFTLREDRDTFSKTVIWNQNKIAKLILPTLNSWSDLYPTLSSEGDYSNQDIIGSYPADDPRSGWWLITSGSTFVHLVIGYPDVLVKQSIETTQLEAEVPHEVNPEDGLICDFTVEELERLMEIFSIVSAAPEDITEEELDAVDNAVRKYERNVHTDVVVLLGEHITKTSFVPHRHFLEPASYQPGIYIYSIDPEQEFNIVNTAISIRRFDGTHSIYYFKDNILHREPPFTLSDSIHTSIMNNA